jgi:hypothetical protein
VALATLEEEETARAAQKATAASASKLRIHSSASQGG